MKCTVQGKNRTCEGGANHKINNCTTCWPQLSKLIIIIVRIKYKQEQKIKYRAENVIKMATFYLSSSAVTNVWPLVQNTKMQKSLTGK